MRRLLAVQKRQGNAFSMAGRVRDHVALMLNVTDQARAGMIPHHEGANFRNLPGVFTNQPSKAGRPPQASPVAAVGPLTLCASHTWAAGLGLACSCQQVAGACCSPWSCRGPQWPRGALPGGAAAAPEAGPSVAGGIGQCCAGHTHAAPLQADQKSACPVSNRLFHKRSTDKSTREDWADEKGWRGASRAGAPRWGVARALAVHRTCCTSPCSAA